MDVYYDTEQPLSAGDFERLAKRVLAISDEEKAALRTVLSEFFVLDGDVYRNARCDREIQKYQQLRANASKAGQASAEARFNARSTPVKRASRKRTTNQNQNQEPINPLPPEAQGAGVTQESWSAFAEMRLAIKKPMTERAVQMMAKQLARLAAEGWNPNDLLDTSTRNSWQDVYPDKVQKTGANARRLVL